MCVCVCVYESIVKIYRKSNLFWQMCKNPWFGLIIWYDYKSNFSVDSRN